jgi:hydroxymethylbilane synthase
MPRPRPASRTVFNPPIVTIKVTIATRESRLALWQAGHVRALLESRLGWDVRLLGMTTQGDQILDRSLSKVGGKGLFVKELETALSDGRADLAVHSLKDVPMDLPEGFALACVLEREDPRDAFVSNDFASLNDLPQGAVVGTSSLRRLVLLRALRPDLRIEPLRGNLDTRLRKLDERGYDAIVLAAAGLVRLGLGGRIRHAFAPGDMLPAAGQGALGIEVRSERRDLMEALAPLADRASWLGVTAERCVSREMGGSCSMPLAAFSTPAGAGHGLRLDAAWGDPALAEKEQAGASSAPNHALAGPRIKPLVFASATGEVETFAQAEALGALVAAQLQAKGAVWAGKADASANA